MLRIVALVLVESVMAGCMVPYAFVPSRIEIGGIKSYGTVPIEKESIVEEKSEANLLHLRVGLNPMQGFNGWHDRGWDVGAGYLANWYWAEGSDDPFVHHGFYLEGAYFPWRHEFKSSALRLCLVSDIELLLQDFSDQAEVGPGITIGTIFEWTSTAATSYANTSGGGLGSSAASVGALYGEWAIGVGISAAYRHLFNRNFFSLIATISFRLPFGAGFAGVSN